MKPLKTIIVLFSMISIAMQPSAVAAERAQPRVEFFEPTIETSSKQPSKKLPCLVILHGSGGLDKEGGFFRELAKSLSQGGRICAVLHYMDITRQSSASQSDMGKSFGIWSAVIQRSLARLSEDPRVDPKRISLLGHSLGAQLALDIGSRDNKIISVVSLSGSLVRPIKQIKKMPPVLIIHGARDSVVPISKAKELRNRLKAIGCQPTEEIFRYSDHSLSGISFETLTELIAKFLHKIET